jgi:ankyrin repeat protein
MRRQQKVMSGRRQVSVGTALLAIALLAGAALPPDPLLDAVKSGDVAAVRSLLERGADPNVAQGDGLTALHLAAQDGKLEIARVLLGAKAAVSARTRIGGYTPLHLAAGGGHTDLVGALLAAGADPSVTTTTSGVTPLHLAAAAVNGEGAVRILLQHGAPVNVVETAAGQTALMFAASQGRAGSVRALLQAGADPAIATRGIDVLERMAIDQEANGRLRDALDGIRKSTPDGTARALTPAEEQKAIQAQRAFLTSEVEVRKTLAGFHADSLASEKPSWNTPSGYESKVLISVPPVWETWVRKTGGMTALLHAAREGQMDAALALLEGGASVDQSSHNGTSPLLMALLNGHYDLAMKLIERGADPNIATNTDGAAPLFAVLQTQWGGKFTDSPQPRAQDNQQAEHMEVVNALLKAGADPNARLTTHLWYWEFTTGSRLGLDLTGATPFWRAAFAQDVEAMKALVARGADPNIPTKWPAPGMRQGRQQDGRLQEDSGLPIIPEGTPAVYPIHAAAGGGWLGVGAYMVNSVPNNFLNAVKYLVEVQGADVNQRDSWGYTPLHYASVRGGNDVIEYLVAKGADPKAISRLGQSTADMARGGNGGYFERPAYPATVDLLVRLGSELRCLNTHFRGTGDFCVGSGAEPFEHMVAPARPPIPE